MQVIFGALVAVCAVNFLQDGHEVSSNSSSPFSASNLLNSISNLENMPISVSNASASVVVSSADISVLSLAKY